MNRDRPVVAPAPPAKNPRPPLAEDPHQPQNSDFPFAGAVPTIRPPHADRGATGTIHADDQPVDPQAPRRPALQAQAPGHAGVPAEARRVPAGQDDDPEEAELGPPEDRPGAPLQRDRSDGLHPG